MNAEGTKSIVVLARGDLSTDDAALAVRVALALPLGGLAVRLLLVDAASALGLSDPPDLGPWSSGLVRELEALVTDEEVPVLVEQESLGQLGLAGRALRPGVETVPRSQVAAICAAADSCLVL
ncbi:MAG: hypothetical protein WBF51_10795 [Candidatus Dormiibacterota bacterium]